MHNASCHAPNTMRHDGMQDCKASFSPLSCVTQEILMSNAFVRYCTVPLLVLDAGCGTYCTADVVTPHSSVLNQPESRMQKGFESGEDWEWHCLILGVAWTSQLTNYQDARLVSSKYVPKSWQLCLWHHSMFWEDIFLRLSNLVLRIFEMD